MPVSAAENRFVMDQLTQRSREDIVRLWDAAVRLPDVDFFQYVSDAFPDIVIPYHQLAADFAASAFEEDFPALATTAITVDPPPVQALRKSAQWALGADGVKAIDRMSGTVQRHIYDGSRDTTAINAEGMGMRWVRVARPNACAFCRLLASRSASPDYENYFYSQAKLKIDPETGRPYADRRMTTVVRSDRKRVKRKIGSEYHDDCKCVAKAVPVGRTPLDYLYEQEPDAAFAAEQFIAEYEKARKDADSGDPKQILSAWRGLADDIA